MRKDRAIKAVERMEALGSVDYLGEYYDREAFINRFEQLDESEIKPEFIKFLDMSDFRFNLMVPVIKPLVKTAIKAEMKTIERNLTKMRAAQ